MWLFKLVIDMSLSFHTQYTIQLIIFFMLLLSLCVLFSSELYLHTTLKTLLDEAEHTVFAVVSFFLSTTNYHYIRYFIA